MLQFILNFFKLNKKKPINMYKEWTWSYRILDYLYRYPFNNLSIKDKWFINSLWPILSWLYKAWYLDKTKNYEYSLYEINNKGMKHFENIIKYYKWK